MTKDNARISFIKNTWLENEFTYCSCVCSTYSMYVTTPRVHMSVGKETKSKFTTSGARNSGVPNETLSFSRGLYLWRRIVWCLVALLIFTLIYSDIITNTFAPSGESKVDNLDLMARTINTEDVFWLEPKHNIQYYTITDTFSTSVSLGTNGK